MMSNTLKFIDDGIVKLKSTNIYLDTNFFGK